MKKLKELNYSGLIFIALSLLITAIIIITSILGLGPNQSATSFFSLVNQAEELKPVNTQEDLARRKLHLAPKDSLLIESLASNYVNIGIENLQDVPLLTQVAQNREAAQSQESLDLDFVPWFYYSPNVPLVSPTSHANQYRLIRQETVNGFAWYDYQGEELLFRDNQRYTGWYSLAGLGWYYYIDGQQQDIQFSIAEAEEIVAHRDLLLDLVPLVDYDFYFVEDPYKFNRMNVVRPVNYSILYKSTESMILTAPPATYQSRFLSTTEGFYDMPMEVVEEYDSFGEKWLHVYIGYEDLGWIKADDNLEDYVYTYYSERELLDTIEAVLAEEMSYIYADVGASFINNETMAQVSVNNQVFFPASTQKIYVLGELYHQYKTGDLSPDTYVTLTDWDKVPGAGIIQGYPSGSMFTLDELVNLVAIYSDNTAANMLIETVGGGEVINPHMHQLGMYETYVDGLYYSGAGNGFRTTPRDAARFFALLYNNQVNGEPYDELLINKFNMNSHNFLRLYIPWSTHSWNKSGLGSTEQNDVATFVTDYGSYSLAVYTANPANYDGIAHQLGSLSLRVHDVFNEIRSQLWITVEEGY